MSLHGVGIHSKLNFLAVVIAASTAGSSAVAKLLLLLLLLPAIAGAAVCPTPSSCSVVLFLKLNQCVDLVRGKHARAAKKLDGLRQIS
jgi:hypothetical protein